MLDKLYRYWRALGTGLCFAAFGACSLVANFTVLPVMLLWPAIPETRQRRIRVFISWSFRALLAVIAALRLGWVKVEGQEWLAQANSKLIVATHPMYLDIVALISLLPTADCVVKSSTLRNPFTRYFARAAGYFSNENSVELLETCISAVRSGKTLIVFPQGTRTTPGEALHFKRGAAQVAMRSGCDILPIMINCSPPALIKNTMWYQVPERPWWLQVKAYPPYNPAQAVQNSGVPYGILARRLTRQLEHFFNKELGEHEYAGAGTEATHNRYA